MEHLTFGEQVKIVLGRKGMTIKELAVIIEQETGKKMSRQNLTQRLGRDNFQEQDMRLIAEILGCPFYLSILSEDMVAKPAKPSRVEDRKAQWAWRKEEKRQDTKEPEEVDLTIGQIYEMHEQLDELEEHAKTTAGQAYLEACDTMQEAQEQKEEPAKAVEKKVSSSFEPVRKAEEDEEDRMLGEVNPYTGREYQTNSVRMHPGRIGYVQVYDRKVHKWTDMTEWAFLGYQERKKALLGKEYQPPIYLD